MGTREYHLQELQIAETIGDPRRVVPPLPAHADRVLDIGCGAGQTLIVLNPKGGAYGIDIDPEAIEAGRQILAERGKTNIHLLLAAGERLPFAGASFDFVISRVALPYMHIPTALREVHRVLKPGGGVWFLLHPMSMFYWKGLLGLRSALYQIYIVGNTMLLHGTGRQIRFPLNRKRVESFQTEGAMRRCLEAAGFGDVRFERGRHFVVTATKQR